MNQRSCGCPEDYHLADCPILTVRREMDFSDPEYEQEYSHYRNKPLDLDKPYNPDEDDFKFIEEELDYRDDR